MYSVSNLFKQYMVQSDREFEIKAVVGLTTYDFTSVIEFDIEDSVIPSEDFTLGTVISSRLTISIRTADTIPTNAKVSPFVRLKGTSGYTEWVPLGSFYIDARTYQNNVWKFTCFDKLILSQQPFVSSLVYPISMAQVFEELCGQLGYVVDPSVVINPAYMIPYKDEDITMREMLGYIASAHAASVRLTKDERLTFVKFVPVAPQTSILASDYFKVNETNPLKTYTALKLTYNTDGETLTAGSGDSDHTLSIYNPFMDQGILNTVMATVNGFSYTPFTMDWRGRPDLEVGDAVAVTRRDGTTFPSAIFTNKAFFKGGLKASTSAPSYSQQRSEFDFEGSLQKQIRQSIKSDFPYYGVSIGRLNGLTIKKSDGLTKAVFNSDKISISKGDTPMFYVDADGNMNLAGIITLQDLKDSNGTSLLTGDKLSIDGLRIGTGTIAADRLVARTITAASGVIDDATISAAQIQDATITSAKIATAAISTAQIQNLAVGNSQIADGSITDAKIVALTASKITAGTIDAADIDVINLHAANITVGTINGTQIAPGAISSGNIAVGAITTDLIAVGAVTVAQLAGGITGDKLALGTIAANKLNLSNHILY